MLTVGHVVFISRNGGMIVVHSDRGFAVVELLGDAGRLAIDDPVKGDFDQNGAESLLIDGERVDAYFQGTWPPPRRRDRGSAQDRRGMTQGVDLLLLGAIAYPRFGALSQYLLDRG